MWDYVWAARRSGCPSIVINASAGGRSLGSLPFPSGSQCVLIRFCLSQKAIAIQEDQRELYRAPAPFRDFSIDQDHSDRGAKHRQLVPCLCVPGRYPRCDPIVDLRGDECLAHAGNRDGGRKVTSTCHTPECRPRERGAVADLVDTDQIELHECDPFKENCDHTLL